MFYFFLALGRSLSLVVAKLLKYCLLLNLLAQCFFLELVEWLTSDAFRQARRIKC